MLTALPRWVWYCNLLGRGFTDQQARHLIFYRWAYIFGHLTEATE